MQPKQNPGQLKQILSDLIQKSTSSDMKVLLLQAFKQHLKDQIHCYFHLNKLEQERKKIDETTALFNRSSLIEDQENLINNILQKQKKKIELDEELQTVADDLFEIEKVVDSKRIFDSHLTSKIQIKTQIIDHQRKKRMNQTVRGESKKLKVSKSTGFLQKIFG